MDEFFSIVKSAAVTIWIGAVIWKIQKEGDPNWYRTLFIAVLLLL